MRTFEIILFVLLAIRVVLIPFERRRWHEYFIFVAAVIWGAHIEFEGYRWQMIPLYAMLLGMLINALRRYSSQRESTHPRWGLAKTLGMLLLLGIAILPPILMPIPQTPAPTGPYPVGTFSLMLVDESRLELYSNNPDEPRALMLQVWYPAEAIGNTEIAPWMEGAEIMGPAIAEYLELPTFFLDHLKYSQSHAYANAPLALDEDVYPLLLFSHGWNGFRAQNTNQMEELASYGYIVAAPDHTYGSVMTVFPDGRVAGNNPEALPYDAILPPDEFIFVANLLADQWAGDLSFILDRLSGDYSGIQLGMLSGRLDVDHVGVLGHSTGGGAAIEFCARDIRCTAVFGMDPYMTPVSENVLSEGITQPLLAMFSQFWADNWETKERGFDRFFGNMQGEKTHLIVEGTAHFDFSDLPAFSPLAHAIGLKGPLNGKRVLRIINDYTLAFFDEHLRGESSNLLNGPSPDYPEVEFIQ
ncbi:MAG: hypothetical protein ISR58_19795 [Anaerolineales bacterium]|nr:hypothetical protein [Chloroflexota bacterium]MBL6983429.1 hypothetical protein [Anaerolineales bacterium]